RRGGGVMATGIRKRHQRSCDQLDGRCNCTPSYEAFVFSRRDGGKIRKTFPTQAAAKAWRADASGELRRGKLRPPVKVTVEQAADAWLVGARDGSIETP